MHAHALARSLMATCLSRDPETNAWCRHRPVDGVFCAVHAHEFRCTQAAEAATRLAVARSVLEDPSTPPVRRWWTAFRARRDRSIRRRLLLEIARYEGPVADIVVAIEGPLLAEDPDRRR